jgi:hypothetical protein
MRFAHVHLTPLIRQQWCPQYQAAHPKLAILCILTSFLLLPTIEQHRATSADARPAAYPDFSWPWTSAECYL